jgi:cell division inhibitor SulA
MGDWHNDSISPALSERRHGFLPLQGLEIPLMVLQTKIFLIVLLRDYSPHVSRRRTFIRRVQHAMHKSFSHPESHVSKIHFSSKVSNVASQDSCIVDLEAGEAGVVSNNMNYLSPSEAPEKIRSLKEGLADGLLFTRVPFAEPRRAIQIKLRLDRELDR